MSNEVLYKQREWLDQKYWDEELTSREMAKVAECDQKTILCWMKKLGVSRRTVSEARRLSGAKPEERVRRSARISVQLRVRWQDPEYRESMTGANSPSWTGNPLKSGYPREFDACFRALVKEADGNRCVVCDSSKRLRIHHIDYDKFHTDIDNCVTVCGACHFRIHVLNKKTRKKWQKKWRKYFEKYVQGDN